MTDNSGVKVGGLLLAAGGSSRLGRPKQLVHFKGKTLLRRAAETLADSECKPVVVVLGAELQCSTAELNGLSVTYCVNDDWQSGMSSSIRTGLIAILNIEPKLDAVMISLCDQPNVTAADIDAFITEFRTARPQIVAAAYENIAGVPAIFSAELFPKLLDLSGDKGARDLIRNNADVLVKIPLEAASIDIDNLDDLNRLETV
ncbi:nucleotidyltransferase family protein [soil metagenome]